MSTATQRESGLYLHRDMLGPGMYAVGHELAEDAMHDTQPPVGKPRRKRRPRKLRRTERLVETEIAAKRVKYEQAQLALEPFGDTLYPSDS